MQTKSYEKFKCNKGLGKCKIDSKSWKSCRYCRFQKCLASGMKPAWVLNESERKARHEKRTAGKSVTKALVPVTTTMSTSTALVPRPRAEDFSEDELRLFLQKQNQWKSFAASRMSDFYTVNPYLFKTLVSALYYRTVIPFYELSQIECGFRSICFDFFMSVPDMAELSLHDRYDLGTYVGISLNDFFAF